MVMGGERRGGQDKEEEGRGEEGDGCPFHIPKYATVSRDDRGLVPWNVSGSAILYNDRLLVRLQLIMSLSTN